MTLLIPLFLEKDTLIKTDKECSNDTLTKLELNLYEECFEKDLIIDSM